MAATDNSRRPGAGHFAGTTHTEPPAGRSYHNLPGGDAADETRRPADTERES
ncbi:MAG: hypothetical protein WC977_09655 [Anaerovoracaceae bacterium]